MWPPRALCTTCLATIQSHRTLSGAGTVYSFSIVHKGAPPGWDEATPYVLAYVALDEGPTVLSNVVGAESLDVQVGDRVTISNVTAGEQPGPSALRFLQ